MIDLNRKQKEQEESMGAIVAALVPFLVIFLAAAMWRLG